MTTLLEDLRAAVRGEVRFDSGDRALYAPHTKQGFKAPANKTMLLLINGLLAKRGVRQARRAGPLGDR